MRRKTGFRKGAGFFTLMILLLTAFLPSETVHAADRLQDVGDKLVIVIDPGHGGENLGTIENGYEEKGMTIITALAMYEELSLYDDVEVYLTRISDVEEDIKLEDRAAFAASVEADFLFSIHYNASANHELFGSEVWVSAFAPFNGYGYQFGYELLSDMRDYGLLIRGVKTRLGDKGGNYYGIIRYSEAVGVPAVIIEHCHVDESRDEVYCDTQEKLQEFGRMDATAVARYFGLKSSVLGVDYSGYSLIKSSDTTAVLATVRDGTAPDVCQIELLETDYETGQLSLEVTAVDYDTPLLYYSYSLDGGLTFQPREPWPGSDTLTGSYPDTFTLNLKIPPDTSPTVILRAYNMYDLYTESNAWISPQWYHYQEEEELLEVAGSAQAGGTESEENSSETDRKEVAGNAPDDSDTGQEGESPVSFLTFLVICLVVVLALFFLLLVSQAISDHKHKRAARQRRKAQGQNRNRPSAKE
ncbi:MAG: N-acetylmuramoyl-L-alanine amidase [Acetatifactor sp.]|nr:N-acetylmuramoyl-L-alanine amidase [Acetatifactor sp.]